MLEAQERFIVSHDWITILFIFVLALIASTKYIFNVRFNKLFSVVYSDKYYTDYVKTRPLIFNLFHGFIILIFIFNISMLIYYTFESFTPHKFTYGLPFYSQVVLAVIIYVILRYLIGVFLGSVFESSTIQKYFTFLKINNLGLISLYLFPALILINYTPLSLRKFLTSIIVISVVILVIQRYFSILKNDQIKFNKIFYLILYLCTLEITPFIVAYKLIVS